ncbi:MAG: Rab family GTPase [Candidatus Hermodarchaeota archaeon]|nr:Rab family GTPase [Candidatus Hermodarchaeota archaeon]
MENEGIMLKLVVAGEGGVGKTTLIRRYVDGVFHDSKLTVGTAFAAKTLTINDGGDPVPIKLQLWDFGGEKRFRFLLPKFCLGARGAMLAFDLNRFSTFLKLDEWLKLLRENTEDIPIIVIGTKADLHRAVDRKEVIEYAKSNGLKAYFETSSKDDVNVTPAFEYIAKQMFNSIRKGLKKAS